MLVLESLTTIQMFLLLDGFQTHVAAATKRGLNQSSYGQPCVIDSVKATPRLLELSDRVDNHSEREKSDLSDFMPVID